MIAEVLIYVPSIANFRLNWLNDRLAAAHTAALVLDAAPRGMVPESLDPPDPRQRRRQGGGDEDGRRSAACWPSPKCRPMMHQDVDMRDITSLRAIVERVRDAVRSCSDTDLMRAVGPAPMGGDFVEIVLDNGPAAPGDAALLGQHPAAVAGRSPASPRRWSISPCIYMFVRPMRAHHRQHDGVPRRTRRIPAA